MPFDHLAAFRDQGLVVIEDAAQARLATWNGETIGTHAVAACFSFYPGKNLGALGDAGLQVSDDDELLDTARRLRDHGSTTRYVHTERGWCSRLDGLRAGFLGVKLRFLAEWTAGSRAGAERYRDRLTGAAEVELVLWEDGAVHHPLVVRVEAGRREDLLAAVAHAGIGTGTHYPVPLSQQPWLADAAAPAPASEVAASEVLSLPMVPLLTKADVDEVCDRLLVAVSAR